MVPVLIRAVLYLVLLFTSYAAVAQNKPVTNGDVIRMVNEGLAESVILKVIASGNAQFDVSPEGVIALSKAKVGENIVNAVIEAHAKKSQKTSAEMIPERIPATNTAVEIVPGLPLEKAFYYKSPTEFTRMEEQTPAVKLKGTGMFRSPLSHAGSVYEFKKNSARVQVSESRPKFYYRNAEANPDMLTIVSVDKKKNSREAEYFSSSTFGNSRIGPKKDKQIEMIGKRLAADIVEYSPAEDLPPGEYVIDVGGYPLYDFGVVDAKSER